jgi:diguanylate cyclase (GGDEF)-like protein
MSLLKQLFLAICVFLLVAFSGSFLVGLETSREQMLGQLRSHAQDAATALGLSLTPHVDDPAMLELMVSSIFDSGYFSRIRVIDLREDNVLVERAIDADSAGVPNWFEQLVALRPQGGDALLMRGWQQAARIEVQSNPQFALAKLWDSAVGSLAWLTLCASLSALLGGWLLRRQLRPLDQMARQAEAISQREFVTAPKAPRTPELRRVVLAMNQMVEKLKALFAEEALRSEQLLKASFQDSLTGLANRRLLEARLANDLLPQESNSQGFLVMLRLNDLAGLNQRLGGQRVDALLCAVAELLERQLQPSERAGWLAARNRGGEFSLLAPVMQAADAQRLASELSAALENLRTTGASDQTPVGFLGVVPYTPGQSLQELMLRMDQALAQAQHHPNQPWALLADTGPAPVQVQQDWHQLIDSALQRRQLLLYLQPVVSCVEPTQVLHHKVLARLLDGQGQPIAAGHFLPWVERLGWASRFDLVMLQQTLDTLHHTPRSLALSLSASTLRDPASLEQVLQLLAAYPGQAHWLTLEADERHLPPAAELQQLSQRLRDTGYRFGLQHFGGRFSQIGNLTHLGLAHLKIDGSYIRGIDRHADKKMFIEAIFRATNSIDLPLIAEMVETEEELRVICQLGLQGAMGRHLGAPKAAD